MILNVFVIKMYNKTQNPGKKKETLPVRHASYLSHGELPHAPRSDVCLVAGSLMGSRAPSFHGGGHPQRGWGRWALGFLGRDTQGFPLPWPSLHQQEYRLRLLLQAALKHLEGLLFRVTLKRLHQSCPNLCLFSQSCIVFTSLLCLYC